MGHVMLRNYFLFLRSPEAFHRTLQGPSLTSSNTADSSGLAEMQHIENAKNQVRTVMNILSGIKESNNARVQQMARYKVEWHRKLTLSAACFILFMIGAPLGAIIRKGGLGMPLVISVLFFLAYHVLSITGEKFAKEAIIPAWRGMWLSASVLLPIGLFLIYKATHDSVIFDRDAYLTFFKRLFSSKKKDSLR
jgi:lipopolysaccharide export system permease protein